MNYELENKLIENHPILKRSLNEDPRSPFPMFGIECGDGWYNLIDELCSKIEPLVDDDFYVTQIKEKYASLSFYVGSATEEVFDIINEYEHLSIRICESCGKNGRVINHFGWYKTLCESCEKDWVNSVQKTNKELKDKPLGDDEFSSWDDEPGLF
jgi:hypothetical protein